ncbi:hypothetical protein ANN_27279 [Periplaneta americana]|uniref:Uncharacterized protein n=1 Tax=Periplaneta americana TaxID=6978 RepID=A0ABQ8RY55_PERAM|nr:hypothetical protein ANN_27279 [Periplaneta americana]
MAGLCEDGNEPPGSLKASNYERTTSEGRLRRASENSTRRSDCGSTGKVSESEDQFIRMPHAVGSPGRARGSATIWRNCALPTDGVGEDDEQLLRGKVAVMRVRHCMSVLLWLGIEVPCGARASLAD